MANTETNTATAPNPVTVSFDENEINTTGKVIAGILLVIFLVAPLLLIVGLWPDRIPGPGEGQWYNGRLFHLKLNTDPKTFGNIHINTIMFSLVALAGFLGSMIHVSSSFVDYVGAGKLKRNWFLWYVVKPFTGAGIGVIFYFVLKAGLLSFDGAQSGNPYGLVMLAVLAGLFTDKATLKLEEIFTALFHPKDARPDKMNETSIKITGFDPAELILDADNNILIKGEGLDKSPLLIKINDSDIAEPVIKGDSISFNYKVPDDLKTSPELLLTIFNDKGTALYKGKFKISGKPSTEDTNPTPTTAAANNEGVLIEDEDMVDAEDFVKG